MSESSTTRTESDSMGEIAVPADRYWGAQTQRSLQNFRIGGERLPEILVRALGIEKLAAARANMALGVLDPKLGAAITAAAQEVVDGKLTDHFPLVVWQTGLGHPDQHECQRGNRRIGRSRCSAGKIAVGKDPVHPNDHVQPGPVVERHLPHGHAHRCGGTSDPPSDSSGKNPTRYPTRKRPTPLQTIIKIGRTHLMDAVPLTLGQEFSGYACSSWTTGILNASSLACRRVVYELALGGTAVGTGLNTHRDFAVKAAGHIAAHDRTALPHRAQQI